MLMKSVVFFVTVASFLTACSEYNAAKPAPKKPGPQIKSDYVVLSGEELIANKYKQVNVGCDAFDGNDLVFNVDGIAYPVSTVAASTVLFDVPNKNLSAALTINRPELTTLDFKTGDQITSQIPMIKVSGFIDAHENTKPFEQDGGLGFTATLMPDVKDYQSASGVFTAVNSTTKTTVNLSVKCKISNTVIKQGRL